MKKNLFLLVLACLPLLVKAESVKINGIWYNLIDKVREAEVAKSDDYYKDNTSIVIPETVKYNNKTYKVTSIGERAFFACKIISRVTIPNSVIKISDSAFYGTNIYNIDIPESVLEIGNSAFASCDRLVDIVLPNSITTIGSSLFYDCDNLVSVTLPEGITEIPFGTFYDCKKLTSVNLGNKITEIAGSAFYGCEKLTQVTIPSKVKTIRSKAFANIPDLKSVSCYAKSVPDVSFDAFDGSYIEYCTLYVPKSSITSYKKTALWSNFKTIEELQYKLIYQIDGKVYKSYMLTEGSPMISEEEPVKEGYTFSGWSTNIIPGATMPTNDVIITGSFIVNRYTFTCIVDGEIYSTMELDYGENIPVGSIPHSGVYTFVTDCEIPQTMPAHDVTIVGSIVPNKYTLKYILDGQVYKTESLEYGAEIVPIEVPQKEGYVFNGWKNVPETMPAHDVIVYGSYSIDTGIVDAATDDDGAYGIYTVDGIRRDALRKGLNIIRAEDGKTRKVYVK